jgi:DNA (cytosine-5)-methyltransferase 1
MKAVSLFSGIGGIEVGLARHGITSSFFCEFDPLAQAILARRFPGAEIKGDILSLKTLPKADLLTAGFPCQDLSQAGGKRGISGSKSGLVKKLLSLVESKSLRQRPEWILIENVPYMLRLDRGNAMNFLTSELARLGYSWAYRVVDARAFGLPQRRPRVILLASKSGCASSVLFGGNYPELDIDGKPSEVEGAVAFGFYWTEGSRGVGWVREGVPPIKCGSTVGIASPPAVWYPARDFVGTIDIRDAERLQGFPHGWTDFSQTGVDARQSYRWRLIGNAVSTKLSEWVGGRLAIDRPICVESVPFDRSRAWPDAAHGDGNSANAVKISRWPSRAKQKTLSTFLKYDLKPLSRRATEGFLSRAAACTNVVYSKEFLSSLRTHARLVA